MFEAFPMFSNSATAFQRCPKLFRCPQRFHRFKLVLGDVVLDVLELFNVSFIGPAIRHCCHSVMCSLCRFRDPLARRRRRLDLHRHLAHRRHLAYRRLLARIIQARCGLHMALCFLHTLDNYAILSLGRTYSELMFTTYSEPIFQNLV